MKIKNTNEEWKYFKENIFLLSYKKLVNNNKLAHELFMKNFNFYVEIEIENDYFNLKYSLKKLIIILMQSEYFSSRSRDQISNSKTFQIFLERRRLASEKLAKFKLIKQVFKSRSSSQIWIDQRQDHLLLWAKFLAIAKSLR